MSERLNKITFFVQDSQMNRLHDKPMYEAEWGMFRQQRMSTIVSPLEGEEAAEMIFHQTNQPQRVGLFEKYTGPSLSVGDVVKVDRIDQPTQYLLCSSYGWEQVDKTTVDGQSKIVTFTAHLN